jgi:hypothetical protein
MTTLEKLEKLLQHHDWYYNYSDDYGVWHRGQETADDIARLIKQATAEGCGDEAKALRDKYKPKPMNWGN